MSYHSIIRAIKNEIRENFSLSLPLIASQLVFASSGFIGTAFVAKLGDDALAASVLVSMIWMSLSVLFFGMLNSISVLVSHQYGANNPKGISAIMGQAFIMGMIVIVVMILLLCTMPLFLHFTSQAPAVLTLALQYMHALLWLVPGLIVLIICEQFLAGINRPKMVLRISLLVVPIEIPLIYLLIFGKLGLPACGVAGVGYGFAITYSSTAIILSLYLLKSKHFTSFAIFKQINFINSHLLKELARVGLPMGFMHVIEVSTFAVATIWIGQFGTTVLAAHQIAFQYLSFSITFVFAMSQAVTVRVGHAVGRQDLAEIKRAIYVGIGLNFICVLIVALAFNLFPHLFLRLDLNIDDPANASLINNASMLLGISGVLILFDNFRIISYGALRGLKDTKFPMYAAFISFWIIGLSSAFLFAFIFKWQAKGIWWGLTLGIAMGAIIVFARIQYLLGRVDLARVLSKG